jgi:choline dehydrogenase-like flavoprotein
LLDHKVDLVLETEVQTLLTDHDRVTGVVAKQDAVIRTLSAHKGVVLAAGGFNHHPQKRKALLHYL